MGRYATGLWLNCSLEVGAFGANCRDNFYLETMFSPCPSISLFATRRNQSLSCFSSLDAILSISCPRLRITKSVCCICVDPLQTSLQLPHGNEVSHFIGKPVCIAFANV